MTATGLATVGDLIAALSAYDPATPVRIATQPDWPMAHHLSHVAHTPEDADGDSTPPTDPPTERPTVWLAASRPLDYLPGDAAAALGWTR